MSPRRRSRQTVTPPVGTQDDSGSDSDGNLENHTDNDSTDSSNMEQKAQSVSTVTHTPPRHEALHVGPETDQLHFESDQSDLDEEKLALLRGTQTKTQDEAESGRLRSEDFLQTDGNGQDTQGMVLRSGSQIRGVRRFLHSRQRARPGSSCLSNTVTGNTSNNALQSHRHPPVSGMVSKRLNHNGAPDSKLSSTPMSTTTATLSQKDRKGDDLNANNNARRMRRFSRSPAKPKAGRRSSGRWSESGDEEIASYRRYSDDYQQDRQYRLKHLYDLDQSDDFSDSDSYSYTSSFTSTDGCSGKKKRNSYFIRSVLLVLKAVTNMVTIACHTIMAACSPLNRYLLTPLCKPVRKLGRWLWKQINRVIRSFIVMDSWVVSRNSRRHCCFCLPLMLLPLLLLAAGYHMHSGLYSTGSFLNLLTFIYPLKSAPPLYQGKSHTTNNLYHEVKQILQQMHAENQDWLSRADIETLVRGMLNPEMEALKVSLLNLAKEGSSDQTVLKVNQNDARQRLLVLEEQMAALLAKAKSLDSEMADLKTLFMGNLRADRERQAVDMASLQASLADLESQVGFLQSAYNNLASSSKTCCTNQPSLVATIQEQILQKMAKILGVDTTGRSTGGSDFTGWLSKTYVDHNELDEHLRRMTADTTEKIKDGARSSSCDHSSSFFPFMRGGALSEDRVRLIVEQALLKYSADRTGLPDYALESAGGSVLTSRCSETYVKKTATLCLFGIPLFYMSSSPRSVIQPEVLPGQCWAFKGQKGYVGIQLAVPIRPTAFSLEHIPRSLSTHGNISSAPRDFTVLGLKSEVDQAGVSLGSFTYQSMGTPIQHFDVQLRQPGVFGYVELRVLNNHGNKDYTCVYRFRVHGVPPS